MNMTMTTTMNRKPSGLGRAFLMTGWKMFTLVAWFPAFGITARAGGSVALCVEMLAGTVVFFFVVAPFAARFVKNPLLRFILHPTATDDTRRRAAYRQQPSVGAQIVGALIGASRRDMRPSRGPAFRHRYEDEPYGSSGGDAWAGSAVNPATGLPMAGGTNMGADVGGHLFGTRD